MTADDWIQIREGIEKCLRIINTSPAMTNTGSLNNSNNPRAELRMRLTNLLSYVEDVIDGTEDTERY